MRVRHLDHDPANNRADNLEWAAFGEILKDRKPQVTTSYKRPVVQFTLSGTKIATYESATAAEQQTAIYRQNILACCKGTLQSTGDYAWKYVVVDSAPVPTLPPRASAVIVSAAVPSPPPAAAASSSSVPIPVQRPAIEAMNEVQRAGPGRRLKPVSQYAKSGELVATYAGLALASAAVPGAHPSNISSCCQGKAKSAGGFTWKYCGELPTTPTPVVPHKPRPKKRRVAQYNLDGSYIATYETLKAAAAAVCGNVGNICGCCKGRLKTASGFVWKYADEEDAE
jgi:hypothetical protein